MLARGQVHVAAANSAVGDGEGDGRGGKAADGELENGGGQGKKKKKNKKNKKLQVKEEESEAKMREVDPQLFKGWEASQAVIDEIKRIGQDLEGWMKRDKALRAWMDEWKKGVEEAKRGTAPAVKSETKKKLARKAGEIDLGISEAKRKELVDWLGL
ncbi:hypothetical protein VTK26DRAFT_3651 [Humicola hyalothermophila]